MHTIGYSYRNIYNLPYGVKINNRDTYIALLWEHKSYADKLAIFQVAVYILDILPEYLKQMLPTIKHEFVNITAHTEKDIQEYNPVTGMVIRSFKYIFWDKDEISVRLCEN